MSNEEQMRAEFEAAFPFEKHGYSLTELHWKVWQAATASKQREIDALNQQVLELSAQVERMRLPLYTAIEVLAKAPQAGDAIAEIVDLGRSALSITPSSALLAHDNEVAAKALEEAAAVCDAQADRARTSPVNARAASCADRLRTMATERRNRK